MTYTCWDYYGSEEWVPNDYPTLKEALNHHCYGTQKRITKDVEYTINESEN